MNLLAGIVAIAVTAVFAVFPVMFAARAVKAENTSFRACLSAVFVAFIFGMIVAQFISSAVLAALVSFAVTALIYKQMLGAGILQAAIIAVLSVFIQYLIIIAVLMPLLFSAA